MAVCSWFNFVRKFASLVNENIGIELSCVGKKTNKVLPKQFYLSAKAALHSSVYKDLGLFNQ